MTFLLKPILGSYSNFYLQICPAGNKLLVEVSWCRFQDTDFFQAWQTNVWKMMRSGSQNLTQEIFCQPSHFGGLPNHTHWGTNPRGSESGDLRPKRVGGSQRLSGSNSFCRGFLSTILAANGLSGMKGICFFASNMGSMGHPSGITARWGGGCRNPWNGFLGLKWSSNLLAWIA